MYIRRRHIFEETRQNIIKRLSTLGQILLPRRNNSGPSCGATLSNTDPRSELQDSDASSDEQSCI